MSQKRHRKHGHSLDPHQTRGQQDVASQSEITAPLTPPHNHNKATTEERIPSRIKHKKHKKHKKKHEKSVGNIDGINSESREPKRKHSTPECYHGNNSRRKKKIKKESSLSCVFSAGSTLGSGDCSVLNSVKLETECDTDCTSNLGRMQTLSPPDKTIPIGSCASPSGQAGENLEIKNELTIHENTPSQVGMTCGSVNEFEGSRGTLHPHPGHEVYTNDHINTLLSGNEERFFSIIYKHLGTDSKTVQQIKQHLREENVYHLLQRGRWKSSEYAHLKSNMDSYVDSHPECDPMRFLFPYMYRQKGKKNAEYRSQFRDFMLCLVQNIRRIPKAVFIAATWYFFPGKKGKMSTEERDYVKQYKSSQTKPSLTTLAEQLDRHYNTVFLQMCLHTGNEHTKFGDWSAEEDKQLTDAVNFYKTKNNIHEANRLGWTEITKDVPTRTTSQCMRRFYQVLRWRTENNALFRPPLSISDKIRLIEMICECNVQEEAEVDWHSLLPYFPEAASHSAIQSMWHRLKLKVPDYSNKTLEEVTDHLAKYELPRLQNKLEKRLENIAHQNTHGKWEYEN